MPYKSEIKAEARRRMQEFNLGMKQVADWLAVEDWHMLGDGAFFFFCFFGLLIFRGFVQVSGSVSVGWIVTARSFIWV
jgi:hypothetical protein